MFLDFFLGHPEAEVSLADNKKLHCVKSVSTCSIFPVFIACMPGCKAHC